MGFSDVVWERARGIQAHIVLPESTDVRMQQAASRVVRMGLVRSVTLVGNPAEIRLVSEKNGTDISKVEILDHLNAGNLEDFAGAFYELRKSKGVSPEEALDFMRDPLYYGAMMVRKGLVDGMVAGAVSSSANLLRAAFTVVGLRPGNRTASSSFVMILPDRSFGQEGQMIFADCATVPLPDAHQLADIAIASADTGKNLLGLRPVVAMLSFSTKGSAKHESLDRVIGAVDIVRKRRPDIVIDGELQADAALVESVAGRKCPGSPVNGRANILVFPDLHSGNICYKLVQRLAKAEAFGPILQGLAKPVNDLSRGCSAEDIVNVVTITAVQTSI
jgi:phosphate acetyltransferase